MRDISSIPIEELEKDLAESEVDIAICQLALDQGITSYSQGLVVGRLSDNKHFVDLISKELQRRKTKP